MGKTRATTLPPALDRIRVMAAEAREQQATTIYNLKAVQAAMRDAAGEGFNTVTIAPGKQVDLRDTAEAKATKAALLAEGFRVEWAPVVAKPGEAPSHVLTVSW